ncbi:helix-turn-helix transcriptional regulator [Lacrimispora saccharolytica]|nr:helix-turn-helix transcriptional regulator [Lacrimispora saccharolytica]
MYTFEEYKQEALGNEELHREYEAIQPEYDIIKAMINTRTIQNLTQTELAEKTGISLADIKKLENGTRNPSLNLLKKLAEGIGMTLKIEFIPKSNE